MKQMKSMVLSALMVLVQIAMFSSCSSEKENYLTSLPAESALAIKVNVTQMIQKSNIMNNPIVGAMFMQIESNVPASLKDKFDEVKQDPRSSGLDLEKPLAISIVLNDLNKPQIVAVAAISNATKFNELMTQMASAENEFQIEKTDNGTQRVLIPGNNEAEIVYNDNRILVTVGMDAAKLIAQDAQQSILSNPNFKKFAESTDDYSIFFDYSWVTDVLKQQGQLDLPPTVELMKGSSIFSAINFEQGKVTGNVKIYANDKLKKYQEKFYIHPSGKFIGLLPENTYLAISGGAKNLAEVFNMMGEKDRQMVENSLLNMGLSKEILNTIEGETTLGVFDDSNPLGIPGFVLAAECNDRSLFDAIKKLTNNESTEGDVLNVMGYYIVYIDGALIATTQSIYDQCLADGKIKELSHRNPIMDKVLKKGGIVVDFQAIAQNPLLNQMKGDRKVASVLNVLKQLNYLTAQYENLEESSAELTFKNSSKNALEELISIGISAAMSN